MERNQLRKLVADLVAIPSVNPLERPTGDGYGEYKAAAYLHDLFQQANIQARLEEFAPGRATLVVRLPGHSEEGLWFDAHLDTVTGDGMDFPPFEARVDGDILFGRGAADNKASVVAMTAALLELARSGETPPLSIIFTATADEEYCMRGLLGLLESGLTARAAVVGEPTGLELIIAHKGVARFTISTVGKAVHSSRPEDGINAIYRMGKVLTTLEAYAKRGVGRESHPMVGRASLSVGTICGGEFVNIVPDNCEIEVDRRLLPGEDAKRAIADVRDYLNNAIQEEVELKVSSPSLIVPGMSINSDHQLVQGVASVLRNVIGKAPINGMQGTTHAGFLAQANIPAVVLGPGALGEAHTASEQLDLNQLEQAMEVYMGIMLTGYE